jgi:hypothetical protein
MKLFHIRFSTWVYRDRKSIHGRNYASACRYVACDSGHPTKVTYCNYSPGTFIVKTSNDIALTRETGLDNNSTEVKSTNPYSKDINMGKSYLSCM